MKLNREKQFLKLPMAREFLYQHFVTIKTFVLQGTAGFVLLKLPDKNVWLLPGRWLSWACSASARSFRLRGMPSIRSNRCSGS